MAAARAVPLRWVNHTLHDTYVSRLSAHRLPRPGGASFPAEAGAAQACARAASPEAYTRTTEADHPQARGEGRPRRLPGEAQARAGALMGEGWNRARRSPGPAPSDENSGARVPRGPPPTAHPRPRAGRCATGPGPGWELFLLWQARIPVPLPALWNLRPATRKVHLHTGSLTAVRSPTDVRLPVMKLHAESHLDHGLTEPQIAWLLERFKDRDSFFIETVQLPEELGTVPCGLHGPLTGDAPVPEAEVAYEARGTRVWPSRLCSRPHKQVREVTVIAGPHEEDVPCGFCDALGSHAWGGVNTCPHCTAGRRKVKHACIVYTIYGGPLAPQEPDDPGCNDCVASRKFWAEHALSR